MKPISKTLLLWCLPVAILALTAAILIPALVQTPPLETPEILAEPTQPENPPVPTSISSESFGEETSGETKATSVEHSKDPLLEEAFETVAGITGLLDNGEPLKALHEIRTLCEHPNREVRLRVIEAVRWIGLPAAMEAAAMMDDSDDEICTMAQETFWGILRELEKPELKRDLLETALSSNDPELRMEVLDELLYLPDELSNNLLMRATNDPNEDVAEQARDNLSFITGKN